MLVLPAQGLPHALVGTYETYKRSTKLLLKWLKEKGSDTPPDDSQPVSLSEILKLAEAVRQQRTPLPSDVAYAFRDAITHRNQMTGWFNDQLDGTPGPDASTMRHEKFTETLQLVYDTLSAVKAPKSTLCKKISSAHARVMDENSPFHTSYNRYKTLSDKEEEEQLNADAMTHIHQAAPKQPAEPKKTPKKQHGNFNDMSILDDALSMIMESFLALMALDVIIGVVKTAWDRAARNDIPFIVAGIISKAAWDWSARQRSLLSRTRFVRSACAFDDFQFRLQRLSSMRVLPKVDRSTKSNACTDGDGLLLSLEMMDEYRFLGAPPTYRTFREAYEYLRPTPNYRGDGVIMATMIYDQVVFPEKDHDDWNYNEHIGTTKAWIGCEESGCACKRVAVAFNLRLQLEGMRAYFGAHKKTANSVASTKLRSPRMMFKLFVDEVLETMKGVSTNAATQSCCAGSLASECDAFATCLRADFAKQPSAIFFQCPITVTNSMLVVLQSLYGVGMRIINHRHYFATTLHVYNALRAIGDIEPIEVLDELCSIFQNVVFLGELPKHNFSSCFTRHRGGKVQYDTNNGYGELLGSNMTWAMRVKDYTSLDGDHMEANYRRFRPGPDHTFWGDLLANDELSSSDHYWSRVFGLEKWMKPTESDRSAMTHWLNQCKTPEEPFQQLADVVLAEFTGGEVPVIKVACCKALETPIKTSKRKKSPRGSPKPPTSAAAHCAGCPGGAACPCLTLHNPEPAKSVRLTPAILSNHSEAKDGFSDRAAAVVQAKRGTGRLPMLQINYGAVYLACADTVSSANAWPWHEEDFKEKKEVRDHHNRSMCFCAVDCFLMWCDVFVAGKKTMDKKEKKIRKEWRRAVEKFKGKGVEEFVWKSLSADCAH